MKISSKLSSSELILRTAYLTVVIAALGLTGCGLGSSSSSPAKVIGAATIRGAVYGGQQPVKGANIVLYAAGQTSGAARSVMTKTVTSGTDGSFDITGAYTCLPGDQVYLVATGGDAGTGVNNAIALMTALGACSAVPSFSYISINEITTVGSVYALSNYITSITGVGTTSTGVNGLIAAFANTTTLINATSGLAPTTSIGNGIVPQKTIYSLANSIASCINSDSVSSCTDLFNDTTVSGSTPAETLQALINLAHNPTQHTTDIYQLATVKAPFYPILTAAPSSWAITVAHPSDVLMGHNDVSRSGVQPYELSLTTANVNSSTFGKKYTFTVDGQLYAQPLYVGGYGMPDGAVHNLLLVATAHGTVYAFDADNNNPAAGYLWKQSMFATGQTAVLTADYGGCGDTSPESSLLGTPAIDRSTGTLYVVSTEKTVATPTVFSQHIHAISLLDGTEKFNGPTVIAATYPGTGDGAVNGTLTFDPIKENQRPALLLTGGNVWITWASHCDYKNYHGYVIGYSAADISKQTVLYVNTPNGSDGGIWMSGGGPAADANGYVYTLSGNGTFDYNISGGVDTADTVLKLQAPAAGTKTPTIVDYFSPSNQSTLSGDDLDFGTVGQLLITDSQSSFAPTVVVGNDKNGTLYLLNAKNLGQYQPTDSNLQEFVPGGYTFNNYAYFNGTLYAGMSLYALKAFTFNHGNSTQGGTFTTTPSSQSPTVPPGSYPSGGMAPVISANGTASGIVWGQEHSGSALLHAYDATNLATELYNSGQAASGRDTTPTPVKFTSPMVANGLVFVGGSGAVAVYGLLP